MEKRRNLLDLLREEKELSLPIMAIVIRASTQVANKYKPFTNTFGLMRVINCKYKRWHRDAI